MMGSSESRSVQIFNQKNGASDEAIVGPYGSWMRPTNDVAFVYLTCTEVMAWY